jgi:hypothetical protein
MDDSGTRKPESPEGLEDQGFAHPQISDPNSSKMNNLGRRICVAPMMDWVNASADVLVQSMS